MAKDNDENAKPKFGLNIDTLTHIADDSKAMQDKWEDVCNVISPLEEALAKNSVFSEAMKAMADNSVLTEFAKMQINLPENLGLDHIGVADELYTPRVEHFRIPPNPIHDTNAKLELLLDQTEKTNELLESYVKQAYGLLSSLNDVAIATTVEAKRTREQSAQDARSTRRQNTCMIGMALISLMITAWYSWWSYEDKTKDITLKELQKTIGDDLTKNDIKNLRKP